ncbi:MAG: 3-hydroxyacyl-CoA dehydrogenase family protein [Chlorobi bacterium]|nr:3-hydroxyacyl-CoA dehydrogenase family protein [Chlorobiota bacterium]
MSDSLSAERFLLFGSPRMVAEAAALLDRFGEYFVILNRTPEEYHDMLVSSLLDAEHLAAVHTSNDDEHLAPYRDRTISSVTELSAADAPTVILDVSYSPAALRVAFLHDVAEHTPNLLVLAATLTCTATELSAHLPIGAHVVGFGALPGWTTVSRIEIAPSLRIPSRAVERARRMLSRWNIETEIVEDRVGLVTPRVLAMLINEAAFAVMEKVSTPREVDLAVKLGVNYPHGLLEWADAIGLDCILAILDVLYQEYREPRYRACPLLRQYVRAGMLGRQTGAGFFEYAHTN